MNFEKSERATQLLKDAKEENWIEFTTLLKELSKQELTELLCYAFGMMRQINEKESGK